MPVIEACLDWQRIESPADPAGDECAPNAVAAPAGLRVSVRYLTVIV